MSRPSASRKPTACPPCGFEIGTHNDGRFKTHYARGALCAGSGTFPPNRRGQLLARRAAGSVGL